MKWYKFVLLGFGIGWVMALCVFYIFYLSSNQSNLLNFDDKVDVYITNISSLSDILYKNGVIQDKSSFEKFLNAHKDVKQHIKKGLRVSFKKAMTYDEVLDAIYKSK